MPRTCPPNRFARNWQTTPAQAYDGEIAYVDDQLGRLLRAVDEVDPRAIVVVTADHGEGLSSHGIEFQRARIYEPFVRVPLVIRWHDEIDPGQRFDAPVESMDVAPTLVAMASVDATESSFQGRDLCPSMTGGMPLDPNHPVRLLRRHYRPGRIGGRSVSGLGHALRIGPFKYVEARFEGRSELYNLETDPLEAFDLAPFAGDVRDRMQTQLRVWLEANRGDKLTQEISGKDALRLEALGYVE